MLVTLSGIVIDVKLEQRENAELPMLVTRCPLSVDGVIKLPVAGEALVTVASAPDQ